ncbi:DUF488 domain-containing protein [Paracoccus sp. M683]|uniref:DUF488 domain-containing protein n=1 Tax=Paracoccus sp. M683 TaxID=2594268 RepID=UPI00117CF653|nr:DUF488 domain-containing protein [Paracoccus sp. M683]TRW95948.1 DUF488 domain-containing protein [Paracoccus sp. M683]
MTRPIPAANIRLKRAYQPASPDDGRRILVDRLWPRGVSKQKAALDDWMRDIAPSTELRQWFGHDPDRWAGFQARYRDELRAHGAALDHLRDLARDGIVTLIFGARDQAHNEAVVLRDVLLGQGNEG